MPWFVAWRDNQPHFPVIDAAKLGQAWTEELCWACGQKLGSFRAWVIGPSSALERASPEPPCHLECGQFAARHCPYLASPLARRRERDASVPDFRKAENLSDLHAGVMALWITKGRGARPIKAGKGVLFALEEPVRVEWHANGRPAGRDEVVAALNMAAPALRETAEAEGANAVADLRRRAERTDRLLPQA